MFREKFGVLGAGLKHLIFLCSTPIFFLGKMIQIARTRCIVHVSGGPCGLSGIVYIYIIQVVATQRFFMFAPKLGEDEPILTCAYFFKWVETQPPTSTEITGMIIGDRHD